MDWMSTPEAAAKWGVSLRYVQRLLHQGRISGARKYGVTWMIPAQANKPQDGRSTARKEESQPPAATTQAAATQLEAAQPSATAAATTQAAATQLEAAQPLDAAGGEGAAALFPLLHLHGGDLQAAYARCGDEAERTLLTAGLAYFRGEAAQARDLAAMLFKAASTPRQKLASGALLALAYMSLCELRAWRETVAQLEAVDVSGSEVMEKQLLIAVVNAAMHDRRDYPQWIERGAYAGLPPELFPLARFVYVKRLYIKWKEVDLLAVAEPLIAETQREGCDLAEIYLRIYAAVAYHDLGDDERAAAHLCRAAQLAMPLWIVSPFIELGRQLARLTETCLHDKYPQQCAVIKKQTASYFAAWTRMYNKLWQHSMAELTPREYEACSMFSRGMEVNEIARRMGIAKNSVKKYLNVAYNKMGISQRSQIIRLVHT